MADEMEMGKNRVPFGRCFRVLLIDVAVVSIFCITSVCQANLACVRLCGCVCVCVCVLKI